MLSKWYHMRARSFAITYNMLAKRNLCCVNAKGPSGPWLLALISVSWWTFEFSSHIYSFYSPRACNMFLLILKLLLVLYRRYIAMVEMCQVIGSRDQLIGLLVPLAEQVLNVILIHFQDRWTSKQRSILVFIFTFMSFWDWMLFFFLS